MNAGYSISSDKYYLTIWSSNSSLFELVVSMNLKKIELSDEVVSICAKSEATVRAYQVLNHLRGRAFGAF